MIMFRRLKCRISVLQSDTFDIKTLNDLSTRKKNDQAITKRHEEVIIVLKFRFSLWLCASLTIWHQLFCSFRCSK